MVLEQLHARLAEEVVAVAELLGNIAAQPATLELEHLDRTDFGLVGHGTYRLAAGDSTRPGKAGK